LRVHVERMFADAAVGELSDACRFDPFAARFGSHR
jgi:hypothetical protein